MLSESQYIENMSLVRLRKETFSKKIKFRRIVFRFTLQTWFQKLCAYCFLLNSCCYLVRLSGQSKFVTDGIN